MGGGRVGGCLVRGGRWEEAGLEDVGWEKVGWEEAGGEEAGREEAEWEEAGREEVRQKEAGREEAGWGAFFSICVVLALSVPILLLHYAVVNISFLPIKLPNLLSRQ